MIVNWPERIWVNSPVRRYVQRRETHFFKKWHDLPAETRCLEIGCGCGVGAKIISETFKPASIDALDIDPAMLILARRKQKIWGLDCLRLLAGDAQNLPYHKKSFDAVFNYGIIHHLEDWQRGIKEVSRVLKKGGSFYFEEIYPPLYANPLFRHLLMHPTENRFYGPEFRAMLTKTDLELLPGYKESRFGILGIAIKKT